MQPILRSQSLREAFGGARAAKTAKRNATAIAVGTGLLSLVILAADRAQTQETFSGFGPSQQYDMGLNPSVATFNGTVVEVHNGTGGAGPLWYRVGKVNGPTVTWNASHQYDTGFNPSVAMTGSTVVEVHNSGTAPGPLWYRVGTVNGSTISWNASHQYDNNGFNPSITVTGTVTGTAVVEVHNGGAGIGPLWYRMGNINGTTVSWNRSYKFDSYSTNPSVAATACAASPTCVDVWEVHNSNDAPGPLWYRQGRSTDGSTISWQAPATYGGGWNPKITFLGSAGLLEVHGAQKGVGPMSYHFGSTLPGPATQYGSGDDPSIAVGSDPTTGCPIAIEVHNGGAGLGPELSEVGPFTCGVINVRH